MKLTQNKIAANSDIIISYSFALHDIVVDHLPEWSGTGRQVGPPVLEHWLAAEGLSRVPPETRLVTLVQEDVGGAGGAGLKGMLPAGDNATLVVWYAKVTGSAAFPGLLHQRVAKAWLRPREARAANQPTQRRVVPTDTGLAGLWLPLNLLPWLVGELHASFKHAAAVLTGRAALSWWSDRVGTQGPLTTNLLAVGRRWGCSFGSWARRGGRGGARLCQHHCT